MTIASIRSVPPLDTPFVDKLIADAVQLASRRNQEHHLQAFLRTLCDDSFAILALTRCRELSRRWRIPLFNHLLRLAQTAVYGIEIGKGVSVGSGVYFVHSVGVVIGGDARVGARVTFMGSNTVGTAKDNGYPVIGDDVIIGCGARILGPVHIGDRAVIGANAVVLCDIPADSVALGIPAEVQPRLIRSP